MSEGEMKQRTLDGDELEERRQCTYEPYCTSPATQYISNVGGNAYLDSIDGFYACEDCAIEAMIDFFDPDMRPLEPGERWKDAE